MPFEKSKYDQQYNRDHITRKFIPFNDTNPEDAELLAWVNNQGNVTQYIKQLIREDMMVYRDQHLTEDEKNVIRCQNGCQNGIVHCTNVDK